MTLAVALGRGVGVLIGMGVRVCVPTPPVGVARGVRVMVIEAVAVTAGVLLDGGGVLVGVGHPV